jgi:hypothetical protein
VVVILAFLFIAFLLLLASMAVVNPAYRIARIASWVQLLQCTEDLTARLHRFSTYAVPLGLPFGVVSKPMELVSLAL